MNKIDFEQLLLKCWNVTDDIDLLCEEVCEGTFKDVPELQDKVANILIGLSSMYNLKFEKLYRMFEESSEL